MASDIDKNLSSAIDARVVKALLKSFESLVAAYRGGREPVPQICTGR